MIQKQDHFKVCAADILDINSNGPQTYQPIPLTPEILEKAGFDEWAKGHWKMSNSSCKRGWSKEFNYYLPYFELSTYVGNVKLKYVHQLQNLYFALTGEEIEIKL